VRAAVATIVLGLLALGVASGCGSSDEETGPAGEPTAEVTIGVVPQRQLDGDDLARMKATGLESMRLWFSWGVVEPEHGQYDWGSLDFAVAGAASQELRVLPFLFGEPDWAAHLDGHDCGDECLTYAPSSTDTREAYAAFAKAAVDRYGPDGAFWKAHPELPYVPIQSWQIWNEQNSPVFFRPRVDPESYAALLETAASKIRAADPDAEIVLGGVFSARDTDEGVVGSANYLEQLYRVPDVTDSFDAIAVHPYAGRVPQVFAQVDAMREAASEAGDASVGLWVTELGWASDGPPDENLVTTPEGQATNLERSLGTLIDRRDEYRLRGIYWYSWRDTEPGEAVCAWCGYSGLIGRDGEPKPAYEAMRMVAQSSE
jgi:polysaccharide biosynthesis protein PslG